LINIKNHFLLVDLSPRLKRLNNQTSSSKHKRMMQQFFTQVLASNINIQIKWTQGPYNGNHEGDENGDPT
jgi:hypothetical protein